MKLIACAKAGKPFYVLLGLDECAPTDQISTQWRSVAACHHPDVRGGVTTQLFMDLSQAAAVLLDPKKRAIYDQTGMDPEGPEFAIRKEALGVIHSELSGIIEDARKDGDLRINIVERLWSSIERGVDSRKIKVNMLRRKISADEKLMAEIKDRWKGDSPALTIALEIIGEAIKSGNEQADNLQRAIEAGLMALEMIKDDHY